MTASNTIGAAYEAANDAYIALDKAEQVAYFALQHSEVEPTVENCAFEMAARVEVEARRAAYADAVKALMLLTNEAA